VLISLRVIFPNLIQTLELSQHCVAFPLRIVMNSLQGTAFLGKMLGTQLGKILEFEGVLSFIINNQATSFLEVLRFTMTFLVLPT
jgi:hypothetical protein